MNTLKNKNKETLNNIMESGLYKDERLISSQQNSEITVNNNKVLNFCANNYLGLSNNAELIKHGKDALDKYGCFRLAAVICELRKDGYNIESKTVHNRNTRKRYARYTLNSSDNITEQHIDDDVYMVK